MTVGKAGRGEARGRIFNNGGDTMVNPYITSRLKFQNRIGSVYLMLLISTPHSNVRHENESLNSVLEIIQTWRNYRDNRRRDQEKKEIGQDEDLE